MRGGKRPGAGAPKKEQTVSIQIRVPLRLKELIKQLIKTYLENEKNNLEV